MPWTGQVRTHAGDQDNHSMLPMRLMQMPAREKAPESKAQHVATADRVPESDETAEHKPFVPAEKDIPELTPVPLIVGTLLGILFGASSMYLVLKVGLTVSASIPVAVLSITIFRGFTRVFRTRRATILENNITQTAGSAGESIAFGFGAIFALGYKAFGFFKDTPQKIFGKAYAGGNLELEVGPELMGVGYIIGTRIALVMGAGGILSSLVLMPAIKLFGSGATSPIYHATKLIKDMGTTDVWRAYILYIGAGAVAAGGIISLFKSLPTIVGGAMRGMKSLSGSRGSAGPLRTDRDLPLWVVGAGSLLIVIVCALVPSFKINVLGALLILVLGFLFVTVSSRLTGEVGSSSNPISGMTVA